jgi:hypothetical protein
MSVRPLPVFRLSRATTTGPSKKLHGHRSVPALQSRSLVVLVPQVQNYDLHAPKIFPEPSNSGSLPGKAGGFPAHLRPRHGKDAVVWQFTALNVTASAGPVHAL